MKPRPKDKEELEKRAAIGLIHASGFVRKYARSDELINIATIREIHKQIWQDAWPEIAGEYAKEEREITGSSHHPPHHFEIKKLMEEADKELNEKIHEIGQDCRGRIYSFDEMNDELTDCIDRIISLAAWLHYVITDIHPFTEGNGRTARLVANLILERYGLVGISVKIEKENKNGYCNALSQIDTTQDYQPLKDLIYEGLADRYNGVAMKYYPMSEK